MPRKTRSKRKNQSDDENEQIEGVANVNKKAAIVAPKKRSKKLSKTCTQQALNEDSADDNNMPDVIENADDQREYKTSAEFMQNGQIISVTVNNPQAALGRAPQSEDEMDEAQRNFVQLDAEESEDGEIDFRDQTIENTRGQPEMRAETNVQNNSNLSERNSRERLSRIRQIDAEMSERIQELHKLMNDGGLTESAKLLNKCLPAAQSKTDSIQKGDERDSANFNENATLRKVTNLQPSVVKSLETIYDSAVPRQNRNSSSSEDELIDTSGDSEKQELQIDAFIADVRDRQGSARAIQGPRNDRFHYSRDGAQQFSQTRYPDGPSTSDGRGAMRDPVMLTSDEKAERLIREAETSKARIFATPGKDAELINDHNLHQRLNASCALIDEGFLVVGAHLDEVTMDKISKGEYVDFGKLIPKDKIMMEEDGRLEMIIKNGKTYWVPVNAGTAINSFNKWEQAFRVYSNIFSKYNPSRAAELIEYNHVIHTIACHYIWDNVYSYDKDFRLHMARNPARSWAIILQQAWSLRLRDRLAHSYVNLPGNNMNNGNSRNRVAEACRRFNRGRCNFGVNCKFEHKCSYCGKMGHGTVNCRKAIGDRNNQQHGGRNNHQDHGNNGYNAPRKPNNGNNASGGGGDNAGKPPVQASN